MEPIISLLDATHTLLKAPITSKTVATVVSNSIISRRESEFRDRANSERLGMSGQGWAEIEFDCNNYREAGASGVLISPLFRNSGYALFKNKPIENLFQLFPENENWEVWKKWWLDLKASGVSKSQFSQAMNSLPNQSWHAPVGKVNKALMEANERKQSSEELTSRIPEPNDIGDQVSYGIKFSESENQPIDLERKLDLDASLTTTRRTAEIDEAESEAAFLASQCSGKNALCYELLSSRIEPIAQSLRKKNSLIIDEYNQIVLAIQYTRLSHFLNNQKESSITDDGDPSISEHLINDVENFCFELFALGSHLLHFREYLDERQKAAAVDLKPASSEELKPSIEVLRKDSTVVSERVPNVIDEQLSSTRNENEIGSIVSPSLSNAYFAIAKKIQRAYRNARKSGKNVSRRVLETSAAKLVVDNWADIARAIAHFTKPIADFLTWLVKFFS